MARGRQTDALAAVGWRMDKQTVPRMSRANTDDLQAHWQAGNSVGCLKGCDVRMSTGKPEPPAEDGRRTDADLDRSLIAAGMRKAKTYPLRPHGLPLDPTAASEVHPPYLRARRTVCVHRGFD